MCALAADPSSRLSRYQRPVCRSCIAALQMQWPSQNQLWLGTGPQELHGSPVTAPSEIAGKVGLQSWPSYSVLQCTATLRSYASHCPQDRKRLVSGA